MAYLKCRVEKVEHTGTLQWIPIAKIDGKKEIPITDNVVVLNKFPLNSKGKEEFSYSSCVDMRLSAPFLSLVPCPYCGSEVESKHDASKHIDFRLGIKTSKIEELAAKNSISFVKAANILLEEKMAGY